MNKNNYTGIVPSVGSPRGVMILNEGRTSPPLQTMEWRLSNQESTLQGVLNNLTVLKAEIVDNARGNRDFWQKYRSDTENIQNEFKGFSEMIHRMNTDFINYRNSVESRLSKQNESDKSLKTLEAHHVSSLTDVRGRISRCDHAISKLVTDFQTINEKLQKTHENSHDSSSSINSRLKVVEARLNDFQQRNDRQNSEIGPALRNSHEILIKQLSDLDTRLTRSIDQSRSELLTSAQNSLNERHALENRLFDRLNSLISALETRINTLEHEPKEEILTHVIRDHVDSLDRDQQLFKQQVTKTFKELESRMNKLADDLVNRQFDDLQELRTEIREGFKTLHESVQSSKTVSDGKHKLLEENLRQEISQIRKMIVLM